MQILSISQPNIYTHTFYTQIRFKDRNKKEKVLKSKNLIFSANAVLDESGVSPVYLAAQEGHLEVMMTMMTTTITHNDDILDKNIQEN